MSRSLGKYDRVLSPGSSVCVAAYNVPCSNARKIRGYFKNNYKFRVGMDLSHGAHYGYLLSLIRHSCHHYTRYAYQHFLAHELDNLLCREKKDQANFFQANVSTDPLGVYDPPTSAGLPHRPIRARQKSLSSAMTLEDAMTPDLVSPQ
jgi:hypothetical protein